MLELINKMIDAVQSLDFSGLMDLLDTYEPDLSSSEYDITVDVHGEKVKLFSVNYHLLAYCSAYGKHELIERLLTTGACPNTSASGYFGLGDRFKADLSCGLLANGTDLSGESRALVNAVKGNHSRITELLVGHECACCGGKGARVTPRIIAESRKVEGLNSRIRTVLNAGIE